MKLFLKVLCIILLLACVFLSAVTALEYRPEATEALTVNGAADGALREGDSLRVLSWNIGYGALGNNADFFMDGGKMVDTADEGRVWQNIESIAGFAASVEPDVLLLQEADRDSTRSHHIDETAALAEAFPGTARTFANNFKVAFVPYPLPPIGKVDSGLLMDASVPTCRSLDQPYIGTHRGPDHDFASDGFQYYAIDGFIVSDNVTVTRLETLDQAFVATDHNPVMLEAVLN